MAFDRKYLTDGIHLLKQGAVLILCGIDLLFHYIGLGCLQSGYCNIVWQWYSDIIPESYDHEGEDMDDTG